MRNTVRLVPLCLWLAACLPGGLIQAANYAWPLERQAGCTSLFGDYRPGRYHAGLDLRTNGEEGWPVLAVADGYVLRAATSYYGYGRVLYLQLDDGRVAVYGHLQDFGPQVRDRVQREQLSTHRYRTNIFFRKDELRVTRGMVIARSGQSGVGAPHLHFEIRTPDNKPLNPEWQGFPLADRRDPEIVKLWILPQYVNGIMGFGPSGPDPASLPLSGAAQAPLRLASGVLRAAGPIAFAVEAYDRKPNSEERHNISALWLVVGPDTLFQARFDTLDYETMSQVSLERLTWLDPEGDTYALFKSPGNVMEHSHARPSSAGGVYTVTPADSALPFELAVADENGNKRTLRGKISYRNPESLFPRSVPDTVVIHAAALDFLPDRARGLSADISARGLSGKLLPICESTLVYRLHAADISDSVVWPEVTEPLLSRTTVIALAPGREHDVWLPDSSLEIRVPKDAVYEPSFLVVRRETNAAGVPEFRMEPRDLVLRRPLELSFRAPGGAEALFSFASSARNLSYVDRARKDGRIVCTASGPAGYTFATDSMPPEIRRLRPSEGSVTGRRPDIVAHLEDNLSGVGDDSLISVTVDGSWIIPVFDPESGILTASPTEPLSTGAHTLEVEVYDWAGNKAVVRRTFHVK